MSIYKPLPQVSTYVDGTFEGGGTLGAAYVGAALALARNGVWFKRVAGNSAGAIMASLIAAGYDANQLDYLFAPKGTRAEPPANMQRGLAGKIDYGSFVDAPASAADISQQTMRNSLTWHILKGSVIDEVRRTRVQMSDVRWLANPITQKVLGLVPSQIGPFNFTVGGYRLGPVDVPAKDIQVGPFPVLTSEQKKEIQEAIEDVLRHALQQTTLDRFEVFSTSAAREQLADRVLTERCNQDPVFRLMLNFLGDGGLLEGETFLRAIRELLERALNKRPVTFNDLPMDLTVVASNVTTHKMVLYSKENSGSFEVAEAVRQSMSIPFIYEPRQSEGSEMMDGGLCDNYPFWVHLTKGTAQDRSRLKIALNVDSLKDAPAGCVDSPRHQQNAALTQSEDFVNGLLGRMTNGGSAPPGLIETRMLRRLAAFAGTTMNRKVLHEYLLDKYRQEGEMQIHEVTIPLRGFYWLDFLMDAQTYTGMCCRGWGSAIATLKKAGTPITDSASPY